MKLDRIQEYLTIAVTLIVGMGMAFYCGRLTGNGQMGTLAMIGLGIFVAFLLFTLKTRIWILIPMTWSLMGQIPILPLPFSIRDLIVMAVSVICITLVALRMIRLRPRYTILDLVLVINILYLITVYIRNPVGAQAFNSEKIGGRPYFEVAMGFLAYLVMQRSVSSERGMHWLPVFVTFGGMFNAILGVITELIPSTVPILSRFYTGISTQAYDMQDVYIANGEASERQQALASVGVPLTTAMVSYFQPITLVNPIYFFRFLGFFTGVVFLLLSGFRSSIVALAFAFALSSYVRRGTVDLVKTTLIGVPLLALVILMQGVVIDLPRPMQRALSFLPGRWEDKAVHEARGSTEWRLEMWKVMLTDPKYIESKTFGDGFGFSQNDMALMQHMTIGQIGGSQEFFMLIGGVHSGPISAVRYIGFVGLALYTWLLVLSAKFAWRLVRRAQSTPLFCPTLFVGIPIIYEPFNYWIVFGGLDSAFPTAVMSIGLLKMLENSLDRYESGRRKSEGSERASNRPSRQLALQPA